MNPREKDYDAVDACVFSSDMLYNPEDRAIFASYLARWNTAFGETQDPAEDDAALPPASEAPAVPGTGAQAWLELVQKQVTHIRENAEGLRKFPGTEQEARARELGAQYLLEAAQSLARDEKHAETLEGIAGVSSRLDSIRATLAAPRPEAPTPSAAVSDYPPLPKPAWSDYGADLFSYSAKQMHAYLDTDRAARASEKPLPDARTWCSTQTPGWAVTRDWMAGWDACLKALAARAAQKKETP